MKHRAYLLLLVAAIACQDPPPDFHHALWRHPLSPDSVASDTDPLAFDASSAKPTSDRDVFIVYVRYARVDSLNRVTSYSVIEHEVNCHSHFGRDLNRWTLDRSFGLTGHDTSPASEWSQEGIFAKGYCTAVGL